MSETLQPGQHPDADQLNAFAEHILPLHEQQETLAHLAACADCRAILYLANPAESAQPHPVPTPRPWFSRWNLAWPAAAVLACLAILTVLTILTVRLHRMGPGNRQAASIATADLQQTPPPPPAPPPSAKTVPSKPASAQLDVQQAIAGLSPETPGAQATSNALNIDASRRKTPPRPLESRPIVPARMPVPGIASAAASSRQPIRDTLSGASVQSASPAPAPASMAGPLIAGSSPGAAVSPGNAPSPQLRSAGAGRAAQNDPSSFAALHSLNGQYHAAPPAAAPPAAAPPPPVLPSAAMAAASQTVAVVDALSTEPEGNRSSTAIAGRANGSFDLGQSAKLQGQPLLPSHLPVLSILSNARQELAIDTAGTLFRSEDAGLTWQPVPAQWTGRAVRVSLAPPPTGQKDARDANTSPIPAAVAKRGLAVPAPSVTYELTTDTGQLWISTGGQTWKRK